MSGTVIKVLKLADAAGPVSMPEKQTGGSAGYDVRASLAGPFTLEPGGRTAVPTGMALSIPPGYEVQVRPRSGLALKHGIILPNSPGTIDSDYRGELKIIMMNLGGEPFTIRPGDRVAQLVVASVIEAKWEEAKELDETDRAAGGFGHTGV